MWGDDFHKKSQIKNKFYFYNPHRSFSDYYLLSGDFVVVQKTIPLIINFLVILWSQSRIIDCMEKKSIKKFYFYVDYIGIIIDYNRFPQRAPMDHNRLYFHNMFRNKMTK